MDYNIFDIAVQNIAEQVKRMCADVRVIFQTRKLACTDMIFFDQGILGYPFFSHSFP